LAAWGSGEGPVHGQSGRSGTRKQTKGTQPGIFFKKTQFLSLSCTYLAPELSYFTAWLSQ